MAHIVFIDSRVADLQRLIDGASPCEQGVMLDAGQNGIGRIAKILPAEKLGGPSHNSLVAYGSAGALRLGSTILDEDDLSKHPDEFARVGGTLAPPGDFQLFARKRGSWINGPAVHNEIITPSQRRGHCTRKPSRRRSTSRIDRRLSLRFPNATAKKKALATAVI